MSKLKWLLLSVTLVLGFSLIWLTLPGHKVGQCLEDPETGSVFRIEDVGTKFVILGLVSSDNLAVILGMIQRGGFILADKDNPDLDAMKVPCPEMPETQQEGSK
jgi:hypothetical protein